MKWAKWAALAGLLAALAPYFIPGRPYYIPLLDTANWGIHEAGHEVFRLFGTFMYWLGGSILQVALPAAALAGFWFKHRRPAEIALAGWWTAQNLMSVAQYIGDARSQRLPLTGEHDWNTILGSLGWLNADTFLAGVTYLLGLALACAALGWAARHESATSERT